MQKLVLVDLDRTLIDESYRTTIDNTLLVRAIESAQRGDIVVGLNSDSPADTLLSYASGWRMKGPTICERGAFYITSEGEKVVVNKRATGFENLRSAFVRQLTCDGACLDNLVIVGDVNSLVSTDRKCGMCSNKRAILVNGLRTHSTSYFTRKIDDSLRKDRKTSECIFAIFEGCVGSFFCPDEIVFDLDHEYGFCSVHHVNTTKTNGVRAVQALNKDRKIFMIGDSMTDFIDLGGVVNCAVENASPQFKEVADYIATQNYTRGVIEVLEWITSQ